jgi:hypothetical protein
MTDIPHTGFPFKGNPSAPSDLVWGAAAIGEVINRNARQVHQMLNSGAIKCARKKGGRWVAGRRALLLEFGAA